MRLSEDVTENDINEASLLMDDTKAWDIEARVKTVLAKLRIDYKADFNVKIKIGIKVYTRK